MASAGNNRRLRLSYYTLFHKGAWTLVWLIVVGCCLAAWWEHHVWIAASLSLAAAFMISGRENVRRSEVEDG